VVVSADVEVSVSRSGGRSPGVQERAALLSVVGDPVRFALLEALTAGTTCVCELQAQVLIAANALSYHLKVLREAGLICAARRGRWIDYTRLAGVVAVATLGWVLAYEANGRIWDLLLFSLLGLDRTSRWVESVRFFGDDTVKIALLLTGIVFAVTAAGIVAVGYLFNAVLA
jgi:ArsR family transcriptional regulator, arsenate/arsenite/antimonite-responsive transcriptional repressor